MFAGFHAASHGVTANEVYDNKNRQLLKYSYELFTYRKNITPIWTLNELAGKHSAVSMWAAAEFKFKGKRPTFYEPFDRKIPWKNRIDKIVPLLKSQVNFVMFYFDTPDFPSHSFSPISKQVSKHLRKHLVNNISLLGT